MGQFFKIEKGAAYPEVTSLEDLAVVSLGDLIKMKEQTDNVSRIPNAKQSFAILGYEVLQKASLRFAEVISPSPKVAQTLHVAEAQQKSAQTEVTQEDERSYRP